MYLFIMYLVQPPLTIYPRSKNPTMKHQVCLIKLPESVVKLAWENSTFTKRSWWLRASQVFRNWNGTVKRESGRRKVPKHKNIKQVSEMKHPCRMNFRQAGLSRAKLESSSRLSYISPIGTMLQNLKAQYI